MRFTLLSLFLLLSSFAWASSDFEAGTKAFDEGKFIEARQRFEAQIARGEWTPNLFYNLGNTDAQIGAPGLAMLNYERALVLNPAHHEARANLKFLREQSLSKTSAPTWKDQAFGWMNFNGWLIAAAGAGWLAVFIVVVPILRGQRLGAGGAFWLVLVLCLGGAAAFGAWLTGAELDAGVIVAKQAEARQAPADRATLADTLPVGSRVRVLSVRGEWTFCELPRGVRAWVPSSSVEKIRLS